MTASAPSVRRRATALLAGAVVAATCLLSGCAGDPAAAAAVPSFDPVDMSVSVVGDVDAPEGPVSGGGEIAITGLGLEGVTRVLVGGAPASSLTVVDDTRVTAAVPRSSDFQPKTVEIQVFAGEEQLPSLWQNTYTYATLTPVDKQLGYALTHWQDYNPEFGDYNPSGGDCANFVSQTLLARGWKMNDTWSNRNAQGTKTWVYAPSLEDWLASDSGPNLTRLDDSQRDQLKLGDIAFFDWNGNGNPDHVMIVSDIVQGENGLQIKVAGHNENRDFRDIDEAITIDHPNSTVWYYQVP
ncbi:CHAP domain-containing protein [Labedella phragmitis]|uniref:CHAP domain-containing protein n=1 Tax=Labedella phragmitis TaxID=2498849 RepID=A0A444PY89_9MICO|nr:amidase domain-containing protein [Labedella phragmitis]RWZ52862.1 CHAP domain-containing protein [Labedella phragmitis]